MKTHRNLKLSAWTRALAAAGVIGQGAGALAEEAKLAPLQTALSSTVISGYVDTSAIWKFGTGNATIPGRAFDGGAGNPAGTKLDGFNLDVVKLSLEKPVEGDGWQAGYRIDLLFGPDAVAYNTSVGATASDFGIQQAYVALRAPVGNGIDFKMGVFNTILGYEVFDNPLNPNFSRSFGWVLEPTQHTGFLASYKFSDVVSASAGVANTHMAGINLRSPRGETHKAYTGGLTLTAPKSFGSFAGATLTVAAMEGFAGNAAQDTASLYLGASTPLPVKGLSLGVAFDYRFNGANAVTVANNWAYAVGGYLSCQATEKLKFNARVDYTQGSDGTWFDAGVAGSNKQNELGSFTLTTDYALFANVITRLEFRWDHSFTADRPYGMSDKNAMTLAANVIYRF